MKKINMFLADWLVAAVWGILFPFGESVCAVIMLFVTSFFAVLNYRAAKKTVTLFLLDIDLMGASVCGILLNNFFFIRFVYADRDTVSSMVVIIFLALLYLTLVMIISMAIKEAGRRRRRRIIDRLASSDDRSYPEPDGEEEDYYDEEDEEEDEDDDDEGFFRENDYRQGFETERRVLESLNHISDNGDDDDEEPDEEADDESKGPKFKVIKKGKK
ncbi:MAG: hypothetical protein J5829_08630 [Lachnospiraceae bacterium]|nr:hypothetical protein [Lachnospiraceae bacterium]